MGVLDLEKSVAELEDAIRVLEGAVGDAFGAGFGTGLGLGLLGAGAVALSVWVLFLLWPHR